MPGPPIVAVTATTEILRGRPRVRVNQSYTDAILAAGLVPLIVPPIGDEAALARIAEGIDGLLLTGGEDVDPRLYGAERHATVTDVVEARDRCELSLVRAARTRGIPTLAICRGIQLANVAFGGSLVQDIPSECPSALRHDEPEARTSRRHEVALERGSRLAAAMGTDRLTTNSSHHQALAAIAPGFRVVARASDGIVEGIERDGDGDDWWMLGVQWHPEELVATPEEWDRRLFGSFADVVRRYAEARRR